MSRIGKKPIVLPQGVEVKIEGNSIMVKGPKGELKSNFNPLVKLELIEEGEKKQIVASVARPEEKIQTTNWGTVRSNVANMVEGVSQGFEKKLELIGVGYKVSISGNDLNLEVGFSHPVKYKLPEGIEAKVEKNVIMISGIDKQLVGQVAAEIRSVRKPEPYKGKGIKYSDEIIRRKAGKAAKAGGGE